MKRLCLLLILFVGCENKHYIPPPILQPPIFSRGDLVKLAGSDALGVVIDVDDCVDKQSGEKWWRYTVMFPDKRLEYNEKNLELYKHAEWHVAPNHKPEVENFEEAVNLLHN